LRDRLEEIEKMELVEALEKAKGHMSNAARLLGINRSTLYYRMRKYGIAK
jgi:two-component system response regulator AtoC